MDAPLPVRSVCDPSSGSANQLSKRNGFTVVRIVLGILLLAAGLLKIWGMAAEPVPQFALFSRHWYVVLIEIEVCLSLWLFSGLYAPAAWLVALVIFGGFAGVSLQDIAIGRKSCDCFGPLTLSPVFALGLDILAVAALLICRPTLSALRGVLSQKGRSIFYFLGGVSALTMLIFVAFSVSPRTFAPAFRNEIIGIEPSMIDLGTGERGEFRSFKVQIRNNSSQAVALVGGTDACYCVATQSLPTIIPSHQARSITLTARFGASAGTFQRIYQFYTDSEQQPVVVGRISGQVSVSRE
jgi:hypothetical protein